MKLNSFKQPIFRTCLTLLLISVVNSCGPTPSPLPLIPSPTPIPLQPTRAAPATASDESSLFKAGLSYSDASGDMSISFLDVVAFQAAINEETETLEVLLHMRDIPTTATLGQIKNLIEYVWTIQIYLDPSKASPEDIPGDFYFALNTTATSPSSGGLTPIPGEPIDVPISELFENKSVLRSSGTNAATLDVLANPDLDTLLLRGRVPGIKANAGFSFMMSYYDGTQDRPDHTNPNNSLMLKTGQSYSDVAGDMEISFLDVTGIQATVNEEAEILEVVLNLRDIPETATRRQIRNLTEYMWEISIFTDPTKFDIANAQPDYSLFLLTLVTDPPTGEGVMTPVPGEPEIVQFDEFWDGKNVNDGQGNLLYDMEAIADPDQDTITMRARIPDIKSEAGFRFATIYYDGTIDRPDDYVPPESAIVSTPLPESTEAPQISSNIPGSEDPTKLTPVGVGRVTAYPGPVHYAGDVLTFEIVNDGSFGDETLDVFLTLDDNPPTEVSATADFMNLLLPLALDTTNLSGQHTLKLTTADGRLNETYIFEVLPADQRPVNEVDASWLIHETACCVLHYISETAAARDIEFIAENFQQAAEDFVTITGNEIDPKLDVYIMDRIWGNGGFGGNGELVISYTDRYYGPTIGSAGLQTLARHEFTHAAGIGLTSRDGIDFNGEGIAVYVAGGHYKPEPLAERGAALLDLGYYVSVSEFIPQHELSYLYPAALLTYLVETYGKEKTWEFFEADDNPEDGQPGSLEAALQSTFGISVQELDQSFQAWLERHEPGEQLEDLRLTIELQDLRRQYQDTYSPPPYLLITGAAEDAVARPKYLPVVMREANSAPNIAVELIIAHGQQAIIEGEYDRAETLIGVLRDIVTTGTLDDPLAREYLDIVLALEEAGYETLSLALQANHATAEVTMEPPIVTRVELQKVDDSWQVKP